MISLFCPFFRQVLKAKCVGGTVRTCYLLQKLWPWKFDGGFTNRNCFGQCLPTATYTELERDAWLCAYFCLCRWQTCFLLWVYSRWRSQQSLSRSISNTSLNTLPFTLLGNVNFVDPRLFRLACITCIATMTYLWSHAVLMCTNSAMQIQLLWAEFRLPVCMCRLESGIILFDDGFALQPV